MQAFYEKGKKYNCRVKGVPYYRKTATIGGKRRNFYGDGEKDANKKIEEAKREANLGLNLDLKNAKVGATMKRWLLDIKRIDRDIKASTFSRYYCDFRNHIENYPIANLPLSKLDSTAIQTYINNMVEKDGASGATVKSTLKVWRLFCDWALEEGYITKYPCRRISIPGERVKGRIRKIEVFTPKERQKLFDYMAASHYCYDTVILLAFATGMRQGELLGLKWEDVHDGAIHIDSTTAIVEHVDGEGNSERYREIWDAKTRNSVRTIPLLPATQDLLRQHRAAQTEYHLANGLGKTEYVFTNSSGKLIDDSNLRTSYRRLLKSAGVPYRKFHCIRHTFATEAIRRGMDVTDLQKILGHSDIATTYIYVQSDDTSRREAMEKMGSII